MLNYQVYGNNCIILIYIFKDTTLNGQDEEKEKATLFKNIDNVVDSRPIKIVRHLSNAAKERLNKFSNDFQTTLNEDSKNTVNGKNYKSKNQSFYFIMVYFTFC